MFAKGQAVIQAFETLAPKSLAMPDDAIGLQVGTLNKEIRKVLVTLEVTEEVVEEAAREKADLIIAHHAVIFRPLRHLRTDTPSGKIYEKCIKHDIAVYVAHTNLDVAEGGINDMMARALELTDLKVLEETSEDKMCKLVVFIPEDHLDRVSRALYSAGAGHIGRYSHCGFRLRGIGTFLPEKDTNPYIGEQGKLTEVQEIRLETIVPESGLNGAVQAMLKAHPYEEPAYDVYPLNLKGRSFGLGRVGKLSRDTTLGELAEQVKKAFDVPMVRTVGDLDRPVRKVAVLGGSGSRYIRHAQFAGADVFITGDIDYHSAHDALASGMALIDPGHHAEKIMKQGVTDYLRRKMKEHRWDTDVVPSLIDTEPFRFV